MANSSATFPSFKEEAPHLIDVAVSLPIFSTFTYRVAPDLWPSVGPGKRVLVPFGRRRVTGYVLGETIQVPEAGLKNIAAVLDERPLFPDVMLPFFKWVADYYMHPLGEVLQAALPSGINLAEEIRYELTDLGEPALTMACNALAVWEQRMFQRLMQGACSRGALRRMAGRAFTASVLTAWEKKGWIVRRESLAGGGTQLKTARYVRPHPAVSDANRLSPARRAVWRILQADGPVAMETLRAAIPTATALVRAMVRDGQAAVELRTVYRDPLGEPISPDQPPPLTPEQQAAVDTMGARLGQGYRTFLLAGVTGSGKTEVYLRMTARALAQGLSVLVLVPEIALISQTERAFRARFGERVALLHSGLSDGERLDQWQRILAGGAAIAVGARSAIFAPFAKIGLIIVDEEHDDSYKQEGALRYHARDLAVMRARQQGAVAILGSATPSLQSAYNAQNGKFQKITLFERVDQRAMPEIFVQDLTALREERGARRHLTPALLQALGETLARKEQALIFLNRRGFAGSVVCSACGQTLRCQRCDISLTYHQQANAYQCHYCGFCQPAVARCPRCGSDRIRRLGLGTERLEEDLRKLFPTARVARMDRDTTRRKGALLKILKDLHERKIDILVGTQMVAKGHDYPHITLVGIICADLSLSMPDFRSGERTFQLLAQVSGRAGRGKVPWRVILQTYNPHHFSITAARQQDFEAFYRQEIECRKLLGYPPVTRMIQLRISGRDSAQVAEFAQRLGAHCRQALTRTAAEGMEQLRDRKNSPKEMVHAEQDLAQRAIGDSHVDTFGGFRFLRNGPGRG
ncbi:MAG: primosomal protein N' [Desulfatitalea sp.]|nr:primosomal protein N' [Desulfatitalea sp.]